MVNSFLASRRGQVFSLDFLIATSIIVLGLGICFMASETKAYSAIHDSLFSGMQLKAKAAAIVLSHYPQIECVDSSGTSKISFSYDSSSSSSAIIAELLGLSGKKAFVEITNSSGVSQKVLFNSTGASLSTFSNIASVEIPFVLCTGTSPLSEGKLRVMVVE